jgi:hypothetical protein
MPKPAAPATSAETKAKIDARFQQLTDAGDWRGRTLARIRHLLHAADPDILEEIKWVKPSNPAGLPVYSHAGLMCTLETYKTYVKITFARGASLPDPAGLFYASLEGNARRAIDFHEFDTINEPALEALIRAAVTLNTTKPPAKSK